jgi:hypothetical protein
MRSFREECIQILYVCKWIEVRSDEEIGEHTVTIRPVGRQQFQYEQI